MDKSYQSYSPPAPAHSSPRLCRSKNSGSPHGYVAGVPFENTGLMSKAVSPTITQVSSRSPTPSPTEYDAGSQDSSARNSGTTTVASPSGDVRKLICPQGGIPDEERIALLEPLTPLLPVSIPARQIAQIHLQDSRYADPCVPPAALPPSSTSLAELSHLLHLSADQKKRLTQLQTRLHKGLVSVALFARLKNCNELAFRSLVDSFRSDDKKGFASLYNAVQDVRRSCEETWRHAELEFGVSPKEVHETGPATGQDPAFIHQLPTWIQDDLLGFLSKIRTDPDFLASRIASLSPAELASLTAFHQALDTVDSIMPGQPRGRQLGHRSNRNSAFLPTPVERLLSFQRHDPLSALLHTCFAPSEDLQRVRIWSTTCARMITEGKSGSEQLVCSVFNAWAAMKEWPFKTNLEVYLLQMLQESAPLLEAVSESQPGAKGSTDLRSSKDAIALEDFFDMALRRLFEILDDERLGSPIPPGVFELSRAILDKVEDPKKQLAAETFIVSKWFFSTFLSNAFICPESHGIMLDYHISEIVRQKLLKEISVRASKQVLDLTANWRQHISILPEIRTHIEHILSQVREPESNNTWSSSLLPTSVSAPQETLDIQPFIVVSPSDLITLVKTLFPETHQSSLTPEVDIQPSGLRSSASSVSAMSSSIYPTSQSQRGFDSVSVFSTSGSSMTSDTTSREPLLDLLGHQVEHSISNLKSSSTQKLCNVHPEYGDKVFQGLSQKLRLACSEMSRILGPDILGGTCHPCAEQWAILFVSADGTRLSSERHMIGAVDDDEDSEQEFSGSHSGKDESSYSVGLGADYHALKEAVVKLLTQFDLPHEVAVQGREEGFTNHLAMYHQRRHPVPKKASGIRRSVPFASKNPYYSHSQPLDLTADGSQTARKPARASDIQQRIDETVSKEADISSALTIESLLNLALNRCQGHYDFLAAHYWWTALQQLRRLSSSSLAHDGYGPLLQYFSRDAREALRQCAGAIEASEAWLVWLRQMRTRRSRLLEEKFNEVETLRDKMWYVTDVKNSSAYEKTRNMVITLKRMARPPTLSQSKSHSISRPRIPTRSSTSAFTSNTEAQLFEIVAASREQGGPNKLADGQADKTQKWLMQSGVENFCKGEERIHRFCLEVQECVNKLVGEHMFDGPVLWSSELYLREKDLHHDGRRDGTLSVPVLTPIGNRDFDLAFARPKSQGHSFNPRSGQGMYAVYGRNASQHSFQSGRWNISRDSDATHRGDFQDYFGSGSPVLGIDSSTTFWSPFEALERSLESSPRSRPATAPSTNNKNISEVANSSRRKKGPFLLALKQQLTSLLLSDLGTILWCRGSETDAWFSGDLGRDCMLRSWVSADGGESKQELLKSRAGRRLSDEHDHKTLEERRRSSSSSTTKPLQTSQDTNSDIVVKAEQGSPVSQSDPAMSNDPMPQHSEETQFPYRAAYPRLLCIFSTHPNPMSKLQALYDLERLIINSITSQPKFNNHASKVSRASEKDLPSSTPMSRSGTRGVNIPMTKATRLEEVIANCEERRFNTIVSAERSPPLRNSKAARGMPSTDDVVDMMQELLQDSEIRPKTIFRDLQYIAAFVPADILDKTERGKAFWDIGLAALGLKQDICRTMVEIADGVVAYHANKRSQIRPIPEADIEGLARYGMEDAARMWMITAKEGDPVAERELAIFYLTHPELLPRIMLPLTMPRDTFKAEMMYRRNEDPTRSDPQTMCVAIHWMELSANGGDKLAKQYLRHRDELNAIP